MRLRGLRRAAYALVPFAALALGGPTSAGDLDAENQAKVDEIDDKVEDQLDLVLDVLTGMDDLVAAGQFADEEVGVLLDTNAAQLTLDIEQMLIESCARSCAAALPRPPAPPAAPASRCWSCANPRLMITNELGGYLENVLELVEVNIQAGVNNGAELDLDGARTVLDAAEAELGAGRVEDSFGLACQAFGILACPERSAGGADDRDRGGDAELRRDRMPAFAGFGGGR